MKARRLSWTKPSPSVDVSSHGGVVPGDGRSQSAEAWTRPRPARSQAAWRRGEGVEPSRDLTVPRLVLKTSGATGRLPSPRRRCNRCLTTENGHGAAGLVVNRLSILSASAVMSEARARLRELPSVDRLLSQATTAPWLVSLGREYVTRHCRAVARASSALGSPGAIDIAAWQVEDAAILIEVAKRIATRSARRSCNRSSTRRERSSTPISGARCCRRRRSTR